jgi:hypothetical protein
LFNFVLAFAAQVKQDERMIGDYPDFPISSAQLKAPHHYWDSQFRRNFNDPVRWNDV